MTFMKRLYRFLREATSFRRVYYADDILLWYMLLELEYDNTELAVPAARLDSYYEYRRILS